MTLLITAFAAVVSTLIWYTSEKARSMKIGMLLYMFWGASLMWLVDSVVGYLEDGADFFVPSASDMLNDAFLGVSVVVLALVVWIVYMLVKDPNHTLRDIIAEKNSSSK